MVLLILVKPKWSWWKKKHRRSTQYLYPFKWSDFLCVLALSSVCLCFVHSYFKRFDTILKYKTMFNQLIKPGKCPFFNWFYLFFKTIYLFFCNSSIVPPTRFRHNHYVPLMFCSEKNKANKKRKLVTSQKCKGSKKRAIYSMHHLWKQDLSVKNYLSNFPDHLNVHENPNIGKSSTFNLIADNFSSLDNITQNLYRTEQLLFLILPFLILFLSQHLSIYLFPKIWLFPVAKLKIV